MNKNKLIIQGFIIFLFILSASIIGSYLYKNRMLITSISININLLLLCFCSSLFFLQHFLYVGIWKKLLIKLDVKMSYLELSKIHFSTLLIKYIPGKVFYPLSKGLLIGRNGIPQRKVTFIILFDIFIAFISALIIGIVSYILYIRPINLKSISFCCLVFFISVGLLFYMRNKQLIEKIFTEKRKITILFNFLPFYSILALLDGITFYFFINLFCPIRMEQFFLIVGINSALRVIFTIIPNEFGIGELMQLLFLKNILVLPFFVLVPLFARLWKMMLEVSTFLILNVVAKIKVLKII